MKLKLTTSRIWLAVTLLIFATVFVLFTNLGIGLLGKIAFYIAYLLLSLVFFYKTLLGEYAFLVHTTGNNQKAVELSKIAYEKGTKSIKCLNFYGVILMQEGEGERALEVLTKALEINKDNYMRKFLLMNIGTSYWVNNDIDKAIQVYNDILKEYTYVNPDFYTTLGYLYILKKDYDNALLYSKKALEESESHAPAFDNIGQVYFRQGDMDKAEENFLTALKLKPHMTDSNYYLALTYENKGDITKALKFIEITLECDFTALTTVSRETAEKKHKDITRLLNKSV